MKGNNESTPLIVLIIISSLIAPLILMPFGSFLPFPYILEEIAKAIILIFILKIPGVATQSKIVIASALLFSLSESLFFFANAFAGGYSVLFTEKLITTFSLHTTTFLILYLPTLINKRLLIITLPIAIYIHFLFNGEPLF